MEKYIGSDVEKAKGRLYFNTKAENPDVLFVRNGDEIRVSFEYSETCQHVYYRLHVSLYKNGKYIKDGNIKDIKKIIHV